MQLTHIAGAIPSNPPSTQLIQLNAKTRGLHDASSVVKRPAKCAARA